MEGLLTPALTVKNNTQKLLKQVKQLLLITFRFSLTNLLSRRTPIWDRSPKTCTTTTTTISDVLGHITVLARCSHAAYCYRWSRVVCLSVTTMSLAKQLNWMWCHSECSLWWAKELCIRWGSRSLHVKGQFWGQKESGSGNARRLIYSKWLSKGAAPVECRWWLGCSRWDAHWCHLMFTTEPSMCDGNVALCQITLTTCWCL